MGMKTLFHAGVLGAPAIGVIADPNTLGWEWWYRASDAPHTAVSPMFSDDGTTPIVLGGTSAQRRLYRIDNVGSNENSDDLRNFDRVEAGSGREIIATGLNSHAAAALGAFQPVEITGLTGGALTQPFELFFVWKHAGAQSQQLCDKHNSANDTSRVFVLITAAQAFLLYAGTSVTQTGISALVIGRGYGLHVVIDAADTTMQLVDSEGADSGIITTPATIGTGSFLGVTYLGGRTGTGALVGDGHEMGIRRAASSEQEVADLFAYFSDQYGLG